MTADDAPFDREGWEEAVVKAFHEEMLRIVGPDDYLWCECEDGYTCPGHRPDYPW